MGRPKGLILGIGINDVDYPVYKTIEGVKYKCPFYSRWTDMLTRVYSEQYHKRQPTYVGTSVCESWHRLSAFKEWMEQQDWEGKQLDKDLLVKGNKVYSPDTCVFISHRVNSFMVCDMKERVNSLQGTTFDKQHGKFRASFKNLTTRKTEYLGLFETMEEAHSAWKKRKRLEAESIAKTENNPKIIEALLKRYL